MEDLIATAAPEMEASTVDTTTTEGGAVDTAAGNPDAGAEVAEGATGPTGEGQEGSEEQAEHAAADSRLVVDGKLSTLAKTAIDKLKADNPTLAKALTRALFAEERLYRELPDGFKGLQALRSQIEQLGGERGIQDAQKELSGWRDFDQKWTAGDPEVLKFLTETPEAQQAFLQIAPLAFQKYQELHPEGFSAYVSQIFVSDMMAEQIPLLVQRMYDFLPADNPRAKEVLDGIAGYVNRIGEFARKQPAAPAKQAASGQPDKQAQELQQREERLTRQEWRGESDRKHQDLFRREWKAQIGERKLTSQQQATIQELYGLKLQAILKAKPEVQQNMERYFGSRDRDGFLRYYESVMRDAAPRALRAAINQALPAKPGPKAGEGATATRQQQATPARPAAKAPDNGFQFVNAKPSMDQVDRTNTSTDMWLAGRAVLKSGQRVQWNR